MSVTMEWPLRHFLLSEKKQRGTLGEFKYSWLCLTSEVLSAIPKHLHTHLYTQAHTHTCVCVCARVCMSASVFMWDRHKQWGRRLWKMKSFFQIWNGLYGVTNQSLHSFVYPENTLWNNHRSVHLLHFWVLFFLHNKLLNGMLLLFISHKYCYVFCAVVVVVCLFKIMFTDSKFIESEWLGTQLYLV